MLSDLLKKNWLTTLCGVLLIAGAAGDALLCATTGGSFFDCIQAAWVEVVAAIGLIGAKDALAGK